MTYNFDLKTREGLNNTILLLLSRKKILPPILKKQYAPPGYVYAYSYIIDKGTVYTIDIYVKDRGAQYSDRYDLYFTLDLDRSITRNAFLVNKNNIWDRGDGTTDNAGTFLQTIFIYHNDYDSRIKFWNDDSEEVYYDIIDVLERVYEGKFSSEVGLFPYKWWIDYDIFGQGFRTQATGSTVAYFFITNQYSHVSDYRPFCYSPYKTAITIRESNIGLYYWDLDAIFSRDVVAYGRYSGEPAKYYVEDVVIELYDLYSSYDPETKKFDKEKYEVLQKQDKKDKIKNIRLKGTKDGKEKAQSKKNRI